MNTAKETNKNELNEQELRALRRLVRGGPAGVPMDAVECETKVLNSLVNKKAARIQKNPPKVFVTDAGHVAVNEAFKKTHAAFKLHKRRFDTERFGPAEMTVSNYRDSGRPRLDLFDPVGCEPITTLTVNIIEVKEEELADDEVIVKVWSENMGITHTLLKQFPDVFEETDKTVGNAFVNAPVWKIKA